MLHRIFLVLLFIMTSKTYAFDYTLLSIQSGAIQGSYSSPFVSGTEETSGSSNTTNELENGGFTVIPSLSISYEIFKDVKTSYFVNMDMALDMASGKVKYNYFGIGSHYYYKGYGHAVIIEKNGTIIKVKPKSRFYYGWDFGFSRVSVVSFGTALSSVSTGIDGGGHWGYIKQMGDKWGLKAQLGASFAYGFSTVSASGFNIKILFGGTYDF